MVLNGYAILGLFLCITRLLLSVIVVAVSAAACRELRRASGQQPLKWIENRSYLLLLSSSVLIGLNLVSWPVLYLLLQSYVQEWPAIMCIYGVTRIGAGSLGVTGCLPGILTVLQCTKPLIVFVSGTACVLYLVNRRTQTGPVLTGVMVAMLVTAVISLVDCSFECAWMTISKTETVVSGGCCTNALDNLRQTEKYLPGFLVNTGLRPYLTPVYYSVNLAVILALLMCVLGRRPTASAAWMWVALTGSAVSIPVSLLFLIEIASPAILGLPFHHCPYDLVSEAPESIVCVVLFLSGCFNVGWSSIADGFGSCEQTASFLENFVRKMQFIALFSFAGSLLMMSMELLLA